MPKNLSDGFSVMARLMCCLLLAVGSTSLSLASERPNIVFILADDLGIGDVGCYGGDRCLIDTPNIDALATQGLKFSNAYANASVCIPTRMAVMTGRYAWRFGRPEPGGAWGFLGPRFGPQTFTLGTLFTQAGYHSGYVGKWHLGTRMVTTDGKVQGESNVDYTQPLRLGPPDFGFRSSFILPGSLDMYPYAFVENNRWVGDVSAQKGWSAFNRVGPAEKDFEDHRVLETFYQQAEKFIGDHAGQDPFFLYLALTAPHTPISPGERWKGKSRLGIYGDFVTEVDHGVGRVARALKQHGIDQNTLVLFSSDHGPGSYAGNLLKATPGQIHDLERQGHYPSGPHRGYKFSVYEGGLHVPLLARWPEVIAAGSQSDALVGLCDLMATFAELTGQTLGEQQGPDSISFAAAMRSPDATTRDELILRSAMGYFAIRSGDWKLCLCPGSGAVGKYGNEPPSDSAWRKASRQHRGEISRDAIVASPFVQLFNVAQDPHEDRNVAELHPQRVREMTQRLQKTIDAGRSNPGPPQENDHDVGLHQRLPDWLRRQLAR